jgi:class 3 adenylate cyclase/tetratricopeptide (TPR) repeat protein
MAAAREVAPRAHIDVAPLGAIAQNWQVDVTKWRGDKAIRLARGETEDVHSGSGEAQAGGRRGEQANFVSRIAAGVLNRNAGRLGQGFAEAIPSVVLCADLSGFSLAGAQLIRGYDRGAEELRGIVNSVFARVTDTIEAHGGNILQFSGDAVMAAWPTGTNRAEDALRALAAGLALQVACRQLTMGGSPLRMRVSVARGDVWFAHLAPADGVAELVVCGEVFEAFRSTGAGYRDGVLVAPAMWAGMAPQLAGSVTTTADPDGVRVVGLSLPPAAIPANGSGVTEQSAAYVPQYLRQLLGGTGTDWLAEFRSSHILFAQFGGVGVADPLDLERLTTLVHGLRAAVEGNGGIRLKLATDDKGLVLLAGWGLPTSSFENNAERALLAADMVRQAAAAAGMSAGIGVTGGKVFAGLVGTTRHMEYTLIGDPVNRAAALSALNGLFVDEDTRLAAQRRFRFVEAGRARLKGQDAEAPYYRIESETLADAVHRGEIVGRVAEKAVVEDLVAALKAAAPPSVIHIVGDAGLGKSRLAGHFQSRLGQEAIAALRLNADSLRRTTGFYPWRQAMAALLGLGVGETVEDIRDKLVGLLSGDPESQELIPLLSPLLPVPVPDTPATAGLFGGGRADKTQSVIIALLRRLVSSEPQVLIVEDAHWFDSASWQLLERFAKSFPQVAVTIVSRPLDRDLLPYEARLLLDRPDAMTIALQPFSRADSAALINASLGVRESAPAIVDLIFRHAEGHPLFTAALALSLRDQGLLAVEGGYAHLRLGEKGLAQVAFPDGVEGVVAERIASLAPAHQLTLKVAAVLGRTFDLDLLSRLHPAGTGQDGLAEEIAAVERAGLVETLDAAQGRHRFHHAIIGDAAYKLLVSDQRRMLHARAARILDERGAAEGYPAASLALLAHHFEQADLSEAAVDHLSRAAENARLGYNNAEVIDFLTRAMRIVDRQPRLADSLTLGAWTHKIADALKALGHYQRAADFLVRSATLLDRAPPRTAREAIFKALANYAQYRIRPHRAPQPAAIRDPMVAAAEINMTLSEIHYELNKVPFSLAEVLRGVNLARAAGGDSTSLAKIYMGMALISRQLPWALDGDGLQRQSLDIAERLKDLPTISWVYMASGVYETGKGGWKDGEAHFRRSMQVSEQCGERKNWETSMSSLGNLKRVEGWFEEAKACSDATLAAARDRDISHSIAWSHNGRLRDFLCLSRFDEAREDSRILNLILNDPKKKGETNDNSNVVDHYARALLALADGDVATARAVLDNLTRVVRSITRPQVYMVQNVSFISDVVWNLWRRTGERGLLPHSDAVVKSGARMARQYRAGKPSAELAAGDGAFYRGKTDEAAKRWLVSAEAAGERGMRYNQAQALFRLDETGLLPAGHAGPTWQDLLSRIRIERPAIWSFPA